jgi:hypothetical protein
VSALMLWTAPPLDVSAMEMGTIILFEICAVHESLHGPKQTSRWRRRGLNVTLTPASVTAVSKSLLTGCFTLSCDALLYRAQAEVKETKHRS